MELAIHRPLTVGRGCVTIVSEVAKSHNVSAEPLGNSWVFVVGGYRVRTVWGGSTDQSVVGRVHLDQHVKDVWNAVGSVLCDHNMLS